MQITERYETANNAKNLKVEAENNGAADVLIAAGWSPVRFGMLLMRLHSEYDGKAKRHGMGATDALLLVGGLKSLNQAVEQLTVQAAKWQIAEANHVAKVMIWHWLNQTCKSCQGRGKQLIPGTPALSERDCPACHGSGKAKAPHGQEGRKLLNYMDDCTSRAADSLRSRLSNMR